MFRRFFAVLAVVLVLCSPVLARSITQAEWDACEAAFGLCETTCRLTGGVGKYFDTPTETGVAWCTEDCIDGFNQCAGLPPVQSVTRKGQTNIPDKGVFDPGSNVDRSDLFGISLVNSARLESACDKVPSAQFSTSDRSYGCLNKTCAGPGETCLIVCIDGKCFGGMPGKPKSALTLIGILQNGSNVSRGGSAEEPAIGGGASEGGVGGDGEEGPECGIGGCGTIN